MRTNREIAEAVTSMYAWTVLTSQERYRLCDAIEAALDEKDSRKEDLW